ncbi:MAG: hypothetical protein CL946_02950 [Ectothiorhodospiraceae bacterium]|nr:hypothetical protein [Ectothiorhodospiraceae bacterium]
MNNLTKEIDALFRLIDDPQPVVQNAVLDRLYEYGEDAIPVLYDFVETNEGENRERVNDFVRQTRIRLATARMAEVFEKPDSLVDLEYGVSIISKFGHPEVDTDVLSTRLDEMANDISVLAGSRSTPFERFMRMRSYLFSELGYVGNREDYYNPDNSYLNKVLDYRKGIPISLSVLMMLLGKRLQVPLQGIGMPMHFLLQYDDGTRMFYIDPFTSGMIITSEQCETMLASSGIKLTPDMLSPVSNRDILERMWRNLYLAYQQKEDEANAALVADLLKFVSPEFEMNDPRDDDEDDEEEEF